MSTTYCPTAAASPTRALSLSPRAACPKERNRAYGSFIVIFVMVSFAARKCPAPKRRIAYRSCGGWTRPDHRSLLWNQSISYHMAYSF